MILQTRLQGYAWAASLLPGQPVSESEIRAAYCRLCGDSGDDYADFVLGARDFGAADQAPRPLFYQADTYFTTRQIDQANGYRSNAAIHAIRAGRLKATQKGKLYFVSAAAYIMWWGAKNGIDVLRVKKAD